VSAPAPAPVMLKVADNVWLGPTPALGLPPPDQLPPRAMPPRKLPRGEATPGPLLVKATELTVVGVTVRPG
jgi:hypothetical protein